MRARRYSVSRLLAGATTVAVLSGLAGALAGCSAGGNSTSPATPTTAPAPGANIDPNANGIITGPINKAKTVVTQLNQQQSQQQQDTGGG